MPYVKQEWANGQTMFAENMNHIENGIFAADEATENAVRFNESQALTPAQKTLARSNIGASKVSVSQNTLVIE